MVAFLPVGYAFGAGMLATVNPCGFAMLPAYLALYLGADEPEFNRKSPWLRISKALYLGLAMTAGFVFLFGVIGTGIVVGGQFLVEVMPWAGLGTGLGLTGLGLFLLTGGNLYSSLPARFATRIPFQTTPRFRVFFLFGIGFGVASLACTLPIFLIVVTSSIVAKGVVTGVGQFIGYAFGMGSVLVGLTVGIALFRETSTRLFRNLIPHVNHLSGLLITFTGAYLTHYWFTKGEVLLLLR